MKTRIIRNKKILNLGFRTKKGTNHFTLRALFTQKINKEIRILQQYNPHRDCEALRAHPERFEQLRGDYPLRRE